MSDCSIADSTTTRVCAGAVFLCYVVSVGVIIQNVRVYLFRQEKYKEILALLFYFFATAVVLARLFGMGQLTFESTKDARIELEINYGCEFLVICIGFTQAVSMYDIKLKITKSTEINHQNVNDARKYEDRMNYKLKLVNSISIVTLLFVMTIYSILLFLYF